jgi:NADH dehydrogenase/NADH:ubiquinone oxidoreductase subunit G
VGKAKSAGLVLVLDESLEGVDSVGTAPTIYIGTTLPEPMRASAAVLLPCTTMAEEEGTFRNLRGKVQPYFQARTPPGMARPAAWILEALAESAGMKVGAR